MTARAEVTIRGRAHEQVLVRARHAPPRRAAITNCAAEGEWSRLCAYDAWHADPRTIVAQLVREIAHSAAADACGSERRIPIVTL